MGKIPPVTPFRPRDADESGAGGVEGAVWATGGPVLDAQGNIHVSIGNGSSTTTYDGSDAVLELSAPSSPDHGSPRPRDEQTQRDLWSPTTCVGNDHTPAP